MTRRDGLAFDLAALVLLWALLASAVAAGIIVGTALAPHAAASRSATQPGAPVPSGAGSVESRIGAPPLIPGSTGAPTFAGGRVTPDPLALWRAERRDVAVCRCDANTDRQQGLASEPASANPRLTTPRSGVPSWFDNREETLSPSFARSVSMPPLVGTASWYPGSRGFDGVPSVALPAARWTGGVWGWAQVCVVASGLCDVFPVVDCLCGGIPGRIVDLSDEVLPLLGLDPGAGLWRVTVRSWRTP